MKSMLLILAVIGLHLLSACSTNSPVAASLGVQPAPATSDYFRTESGGFIIERPERGAPAVVRYALLFTPTKSVDRPLYLRTRFQNPADSSHPFIVDSVLQPGAKKFSPTSPLLTGLQPRHGYKIEVLIFDAPERTHQIGQHVQFVRFL
jgi:hypothetical protein